MLREEYGSWQVICAAKDEATRCVMQQVQIDAKTQQRVLMIELGRGDNGNLSGIMVMPFGLDLQKGVGLGLEGGDPFQISGFSTCLPAGCIVPLTFGEKQLEVLRENAALVISATANADAAPVKFAISLDGFVPALNRLAD